MSLQYNTEILDDLELFKWTAENLPIRFLGDEALKKVCEPLSPEEISSETTKDLADTMINVLRQFRDKTGMGRGLAANQIGATKRMIVVWLGDGPEVFINPELVKEEGQGSYWESCISAGSFLVGEVIRPWKGMFRYFDLQGKEHTINADEKQTRLFLHEIDHLDGKMCLHQYEPGTLQFVEKGKDQILGYQFKRLDGAPMKVAICCSTKFRDKIEQAVLEFKDAGIDPLFPDGKSVRQDLSKSEFVAALAREHYRTLEECDAVYFINPKGYMGTSVKLELGYAAALKKPIFFSDLTGDLALDHYPIAVVPVEQVASITKRVK